MNRFRPLLCTASFETSVVFSGRKLLRSLALLAALVLPLASYGQSTLYVVNLGSNDLSVVDTHPGTEKVIQTIPGPGALLSIAFNPANGLIYLPTTGAAPGQVFLIDTATNSFVGSPFSGVGPN